LQDSRPAPDRDRARTP